MSDIYYSPEDFGLEAIATLDLDVPGYSFDYLAVWKDIETGKFLFDTDSGCSCPSPFEGVKKSDLAEFTWTAIDAIIAERQALGYYNGYPLPTEVAAFKDAIKKAGG